MKLRGRVVKLALEAAAKNKKYSYEIILSILNVYQSPRLEGLLSLYENSENIDGIDVLMSYIQGEAKSLQVYANMNSFEEAFLKNFVDNEKWKKAGFYNEVIQVFEEASGRSIVLEPSARRGRSFFSMLKGLRNDGIETKKLNRIRSRSVCQPIF